MELEQAKRTRILADWFSNCAPLLYTFAHMLICGEVHMVVGRVLEEKNTDKTGFERFLSFFLDHSTAKT